MRCGHSYVKKIRFVADRSEGIDVETLLLNSFQLLTQPYELI